MRKRIVPILLALLFMALLGMTTQAGSSPNYAINWDVVGRGGPVMASAHYAVQSTIGQTAIGSYQSPNYSMGAGYWQGYSKISFPSSVYLPIIFRN